MSLLYLYIVIMSLLYLYIVIMSLLYPYIVIMSLLYLYIVIMSLLYLYIVIMSLLYLYIVIMSLLYPYIVIMSLLISTVSIYSQVLSWYFCHEKLKPTIIVCMLEYISGNTEREKLLYQQLFTHFLDSLSQLREGLYATPLPYMAAKFSESCVNCQTYI